MAEREHCYRHGCDYPYGRTCPECAREDDLEDRQALQDAIGQIRDELTDGRIDADDLADKLNNPGSYYCPRCRYRTLNYLSSCCFKCQKEIDDTFWEEIARQEREERERKAKAAAEARAKAAADAKTQAERGVVHRGVNQDSVPSEGSGIGLGLIVCAALVLAVMWISGIFGPSEPSIDRPNPTALLAASGPAHIIDKNVCPLSWCGERWHANENVDLYKAPPANPVDRDLSPLQKISTIQAGAWAILETGIVVAQRREARARRVAIVEDGTPIEPYEAISCYSYLGGDRWRCWIKDHLAVVGGADSSSSSEDVWWLQLKTPDGTLGWTNSKDSFVTQKELDKKLAETISAPGLTVEKLAHIDSLVKRGADLNRPERYSGVTPFTAALGTRDVDLLRALVDRGLSFDKGGCPAKEVPGFVTGPNGDLILELLMDHNLRLDCLDEPPLHAILPVGILGEKYSVEVAVRVVGILLKQGVNVDERDSEGKTIIEKLEETKEYRDYAGNRFYEGNSLYRKNAEPLINELLKLQAGPEVRIDRVDQEQR